MIQYSKRRNNHWEMNTFLKTLKLYKMIYNRFIQFYPKHLGSPLSLVSPKVSEFFLDIVVSKQSKSAFTETIVTISVKKRYTNRNKSKWNARNLRVRYNDGVWHSRLSFFVVGNQDHFLQVRSYVSLLSARVDRWEHFDSNSGGPECMGGVWVPRAG